MRFNTRYKYITEQDKLRKRNNFNL